MSFFAHHQALLAALSGARLPGPPVAGLRFNATRSVNQFATIQLAGSDVENWACCVWLKVRSPAVDVFYYLFDTRYVANAYVLSTESYAAQLYVDGVQKATAAASGFALGQWQRVVIQNVNESSLGGSTLLHLLASSGESQGFFDVELGPVSLWQTTFTPAQLADNSAYPATTELLALWEPTPTPGAALPRTTGTLDALLHGF
ncbi:MAG: hypothetical protein ACRYFZ_03670 [Janthinobacterium lividum]